MSETGGGGDGARAVTPEVSALIADAQKKLRDELLGRFAAGIGAAAVGLLSLSVVGGWLIVKPILVKQVGGAPRGAVVAFDRDDLDENHCPDGWSPFLYARARTIVGAGDPSHTPEKMPFSENGVPLSGYVLRQHGGEQKHLLTIDEMPRHDHGGGAVGTRDHAGLDNSAHGVANDIKPLESQGGGQPHNIMPPFIALYYCKKTE